MKKLFTGIALFFSATGFAQNVGIGETAPTDMKLQVKRGDSALLLLQNSTTTGINKTGMFFKTGSYYSGSIATIGSGASFRMGLFTYGGLAASDLLERISILDGGNVGIGTTSPAAKLDVNGSLRLSGGSPGAGKFLISDPTGLASWYDLSPSLLPGGAAGNTLRHTGTGWVANNLIYNNGTNIGIGTVIPTAKLEVFSNAFGILQNDGTVAIGTFTSALGGWLGTRTAHSLHFFTNNSNPLATLTTAGNFGIGTQAPTAPLSFANLTGNKITLWGDASGGHYGLGIQGSLLQMYSSANNADIAFGYGSSTSFTENMRIKGNGNVGIGTASPNSKLEVFASGYGIYQNDGTVSVGTYTSGSGGWLGTSSNHALHFFTNNSGERMTLTTGGNLGLGTTNPVGKMEIRASTTDGLYVTSASQSVRVTTGFLGALIGTASGGNTNLVANDVIGATLKSDGSFGLGTLTPTYKLDVNGRMRLRHNGVTSGLWFNNSANIESSFIGQYTDDLMGIFGNAWQFALNRNDGTVYLGSNNLDGENLNTGAGYKLRVFGKMIAEEVRVQLKTAWPDYVFENGYKKLSLNELEQFVNDNKHLPNIPSAKEIEKDGQHLGEIQTKMLEKIEELTLYIIEQDKRIKNLEAAANAQHPAGKKN